MPHVIQTQKNQLFNLYITVFELTLTTNMISAVHPALFY